MISEMTFLLTDSCQVKACLAKHKLISPLQNMVEGDDDLAKGLIGFLLSSYFGIGIFSWN